MSKLITKIEYKKTKSSKIKVDDLKEWDDNHQVIVARLQTKNETVSAVKINKETGANYEMISFGNGRMPFTIKTGSSWYMLARAILKFPTGINSNSARQKVFDVINPNEVIIDWDNGWYYLKTGTKRVNRYIFDEVYVVDKQKVINWREHYKKVRANGKTKKTNTEHRNT